MGTFSGLPQDATLDIGGTLFQISYTGGSGQDVVLTQISTGRPLLTIERLSATSVRLLWSTNALNYTLPFNPDLRTTNWAPVSRLSAVVGANNVVTNSTDGASGFYRLAE